MASVPDLPCALDKHWHHSEQHHPPGADTVWVSRLPKGAGSLATSSTAIIFLWLNPETEKYHPDKQWLLLPSKAGIIFCTWDIITCSTPLYVPLKPYVQSLFWAGHRLLEVQRDLFGSQPHLELSTASYCSNSHHTCFPGQHYCLIVAMNYGAQKEYLRSLCETP